MKTQNLLINDHVINT